jgi:DNA polymerase I-like protein with 3'-5' exonuclease and polymerase domains
MFKSRFKNGVVSEIDYSQLEVVIQAWLTGDPQMIADVNNKIDFHCKRLSKKLGEDYESILYKVKVEGDAHYIVMRTGAKGISFQMAYGAGATAIAQDLGLPIEEVQAIMDAEAELYPDIAKFYDNIGRIVIADSQLPENIRREPHPFIPNRWRSYRVGAWSGPTGTLYRWRQWDAPEWLKKRGTELTFSPTQRKNWPIQGQGGETMQLAQTALFREHVQRGWWSGGDHDVLLTNTVHDCVTTDMDEQYTDDVLQVQHSIMVNVDKIYEHAYGIEVPVTFSAEAEVGNNMYDMHEHHLSDECTVDIDSLCSKYF